MNLALWLAVLVFAMRFAPVVVDAGVRSSPGFVAHYTAGQLLLQGDEVREFYDDDWFRSRVARHEPAIGDVFILPPTGALLALPLAVIEYRTARWIWLGMTLACVAGAGAWLLSCLGLGGSWVPLSILALFLYQPLHENLKHVQSYGIFFAFLVVAWRGQRQCRPASVGAALAALLLLRLAAPFLWLQLLLERRWRALAWGAGVALTVVSITLPRMGVDAWAAFEARNFAAVQSPRTAVTAYQTLRSFTSHLFVFHPDFSPRPIYSSPGLATALFAIGAIVLVAGAALVALRRGNTDLSFSAFVIASLLLSPFTLDYHYMLALVPLALLAARFNHRSSKSKLVILAVAYALIAADLPYRSPAVRDGGWALLAYPKLYGAVILWALAVGEGLWGASSPRLLCSPALLLRFVKYSDVTCAMSSRRKPGSTPPRLDSGVRRNDGLPAKLSP